MRSLGRAGVSPVDAAQSHVPEDAFVLDTRGSRLPQTSNPAAVAAVLRLADIPAGARVLEVGTGSGYSTALLSALVGANGAVTSVDVDPALTRRAARLLAEHGASNVTITTADGLAGYAPSAPYDRIIAWATASSLPRVWADQVVDAGLIIAPVQVAPLGQAVAVVRVRRVGPGVVVGEQAISGSFVPLTATPQSAWGAAPPEADIVFDHGHDPQAWLSAEWLRGASAAAGEELAGVSRALAPCDRPMLPGEDVDDFRACLLAARPDGLTTASVPATGSAIGFSTADSVALLSFYTGAAIEAGNGAARMMVAEALASWRARGRPGWDALAPALSPTGHGWRVALSFRETTRCPPSPGGASRSR